MTGVGPAYGGFGLSWDCLSGWAGQEWDFAISQACAPAEPWESAALTTPFPIRKDQKPGLRLSSWSCSVWSYPLPAPTSWPIGLVPPLWVTGQSSCPRTKCLFTIDRSTGQSTYLSVHLSR